MVLSFRWLNLEGFYAYTIPQKKALTLLQGLYDSGFKMLFRAHSVFYMLATGYNLHVRFGIFGF